MIRGRKRADKRAGGNWTRRASTGKHSRNPGWKPDRHWVCCQRCGFDYESKDILREWTGAIVCKTCWEPRHPQDFVRARPERIQAPGPHRPDTLVSNTSAGTAAAGSTSAPAGTFLLTPPTCTAVPDQASTTEETISTLSISSVYDASYANLGVTYTIDSYQLIGDLPAGLSLNTTTGDITGTVLSSATSQVVRVQATYTSGYICVGNTFTWTITTNTSAAIDPDDAAIVGNLCIWWDFSEDEYLFTEVEGSTKTADEGNINEVLNRLNTGAEPGVGNPRAAANTPTWDANVRNGLGAMNTAYTGSETFAMDGPIPDDGCRDQPTSVFVVAQVPITTTVDRALFGVGGEATVQTGHNFRILSDAEGNVGALQSVWADEFWPSYNTQTAVSDSWASRAGQWFCFYAAFDGTSGDARFNDAREPLLFDDHDANDSGPFTVDWSNFRVGSAVQSPGGGVGITGWNSYIGEAILYKAHLTDAQVNGVYEYLKDKWDLSDTYS